MFTKHFNKNRSQAETERLKPRVPSSLRQLLKKFAADMQSAFS